MQWTNQTEALCPSALCLVLSCPLMVSGGDMCTHIKSPPASLQSSFPVYPQLPVSFVTPLLHPLSLQPIHTLIFLSFQFLRPLPIFFSSLSLPLSPVSHGCLDFSFSLPMMPTVVPTSTFGPPYSLLFPLSALICLCPPHPLSRIPYFVPVCLSACYKSLFYANI